MLSNMDKLSKLPDKTQVFCAHEYTLSNYDFLSSVDSETTGEQFTKMKELRRNNLPTVPSTIGQEKKTNLFMRCRDDRVMKLLAVDSPERAMHKLREMKNSFKSSF